MVMEKTPGTTPGTLSKFPVFTKAKKTSQVGKAGFPPSTWFGSSSSLSDSPSAGLVALK